MKKSIIALILLLSTGIAFSQTTVTLQDQCNCEVLKGTAVSSPGAVTPNGVDTGDIYVNTNTGTIYFWDGDSWELTSSDNQQLTGFNFDGATNTLTLNLENGGSVNVDLSSLSDTLTDTNTTITSFGIDGTNTNLVITDSDTNTYAVALADIAALIDTDDQALSLTAGNILTLEDGGTVDLTPYLDNTDDQAITAFSLDNATNVLTLTLEDGGTQTVDFSTVLAAAGTDDQALSLAAGNILTLEDGGTVDLTPYLDNTDDQAITAFSLDNATNVLTLTLEDGGTQTVDFSTVLAAAGTDDQTLALSGNSLSIEDGNNVDLSGYLDNTDDQALSLAAGNILTLEDGGTVDLTPYLDNTDDQAITAFSLDNATNILTLTLEDGGTQTVDFSTVLAAAGTDDQTLTLLGNSLSIEDGNNVDLSGYLDNTDDQALSLAAGNILTLEDGGTVDLTPYLDNTDDQAITAFSLDNATNILTLTLEDGGTQTVDLSALDNSGSDDQTLALSGNSLSIEDGNNVDLSGYLDNTDDQALSLAAGNILTLEDGGTVDLTPYLDNTDDQAITAFSLDNATNILTLTLEDGGTQTVDLSALDNSGSDDQTLTLSGNSLSIEDGNNVDLSGYLDNTDDQALSLAAGNILTLEDGGTVDLTPYLDNTDDQAITAFSLDNATNILTLTLEDGGTQTVDFSTVLAAAGTDDQALSLAAGNILTLEDGGTVDLTPYLDNTDDQAITAFSLDNATNILTLTLEDGGTQTVDLSALDNSGSDDQTLTLSGNSLSIEDGNNVDLSGYLDNTDDQALSLAAGNILTLEDGGTVDLTPYLDNTDDQAITAFSLDNATNILTLTLEDGGTQTVDLSALDNSGTDDQTALEVNYDNTTSGLSSTNTQAAIDELKADVDAFAATSGQTNTASNVGAGGVGLFARKTGANLEFKNINAGSNIVVISNDAGNDEVDIDINEANLRITESQITDLTHTVDTDDQTLTLSGNTLSIADGNSVDLSVLDNSGSDDQTLTLSGNSLSIEDGNNVDLSGYLDNTDDQALSLAAGNILTLEDGGTVDLTPYLDNTDDQAITAFSLDNATNILTLTLEDGGTQTVDFSTVLAAAGTDDQALSLAAGNILTLEDGGTVDLTPYLDNTDDQAITAFSLDNATNILTLTLEDGGTQTVDFSTVLAAAGTDDQTLALSGNSLSIEDGNNVDLSGYLDNTDDQALSLAAGNILTLEDGGTVDLTPYLDNTDDQAITAFSLDNATNILTLTLEDGGTQTVDLSALDNSGSDDQALSLAAGNILTLEDGGTVDLTPYLDNTDDQAITAFSLDNATNILTLTLEDGGTQTVDFSTVLAAAGTDDQTLALSGNSLSIEDGNNVDLSGYLDNTDDQALSLAAGNILTLEDGGTVDLTPYLDNTDDQALSLAAGNILTLEDGGTVDLTPYLDNTDDQAITAFSLDNATNILTLTLEDGGTQTVDFSTVLAAAGTDDQTLALSGNSLSIEDGNNVDLSGYLDNTDDQALSLAAGNILTLEDGGTVDLTPYLDNTDDQAITAFSLDNATNILTLTLEDGGTQTVDLSALDNSGSDDQALSLAAGNILTLEDGGTVDLTPYLDNTDDQAITAFSLDNATNILTLTLEDGGTQTVDFSTVLAAAGTDDQALSLAAGNILTLEDGGTVDLTPYLDNTDDQAITAFSLDNATNILTLTLEDGGTQTVDLSALDNSGSDDQTLALSGNSLSIEDGNNVDLSGYLDNTDDQALSLAAGNILTLEDGGTVDLTPYLDNTDDQAITAFSLDNATNILTLTLEDGGTQTVDFSTVLAAAGTDDQTLALSGNSLSIEDGNNVDLSGYLDNTDDQALSLAAGNILTLEDGGTVDLTPYLDNTDDQAITAFSLDNATNILTLTLEDGGTQTVDLSALDNSGSDDQTLTLSGNSLSIEDGNNVDLSGYLDNTDDQALSLAAGNILTLEDGGTVDLTPYLDNTDGQTLSLSGSDLSISGGNTIDISSIDTDTDDQTLTLSGNTLSIADGNSVDLSALDNSGSDDQTLTLSGNSLSIEDGNNVDLSGYLDNTDDQALSLAAGNILTLEDGGTVDLTPYLDNTDGQTLSLSGSDLSISGGNTIDISSIDTDDQTLTLSGNTLSIADGNSVDLSTFDNSGSDDQTLTLSGNSLSIEDGNNVDLSGYLDNTDGQTLSLSGSDLSISGGNTIDISSIDTDTDDQTLSLSGNDLTISEGNTIDISGINTDNQDASEVNSDSPVDVDGDGNTEATVEDVIQDIAPITSKAARIFYPPSIAIDASTNGTGRTVDLYAQYVAQYGTPAVASAGAPAAIPTYAATDLYYYITYADPTVFANMSIDANGELTYDIIGQPADYNALINVVFVVK